MEGETCSLFVCTKEWDVSTVTWVNLNATTSWTVPGGDFSSTPVVVIPFAVAANTWEKYDVTDIIKGFIANPQSNKGFIIKVASFNKGHYYCASEYPTKELRPKLTLTVKKRL